MTTLRIFLLILLTLICREVADQWTGGSADAYWPVARGIVSVLAFGLLFKSLILGLLAQSSAAKPRSHFEQASQRLRPGSGILQPDSRRSNAKLQASAKQLRDVVEYLWVGSLPAILLLTGWATWLITAEQSGASSTLLVIAWFAPSLLFFVFLEWTSAQFEEIILELETGQDQDKWKQYFFDRIRQGDTAAMLLCIAPLLTISVCNDLLRYTYGNELSSTASVCSSLLGLFAFVLLGPAVLSRWMGGEPGEAAVLHQRFARLTQKMGIRGIQLRVLGDAGRWNCAAIVGWLPGFRQLWMSSSFVDEFTPEQVDMVLLHELAHVRRGHFLLRLLPLVASGLLLTPLVFSPHIAVVTCLSIGAIAALLLGIRAAAHHCEFDADQTACSAAEKLCDWSHSQSARQALGEALLSLSSESSRSRHTWLHPSINSRIARLAQE